MIPKDSALGRRLEAAAEYVAVVRSLQQAKRSLKLRWRWNTRQNTTAWEWANRDCSCAYHPDPFPHVHPCSPEHERPDLHGKGAFKRGYNEGYEDGRREGYQDGEVEAYWRNHG